MHSTPRRYRINLNGFVCLTVIVRIKIFNECPSERLTNLKCIMKILYRRLLCFHVYVPLFVRNIINKMTVNVFVKRRIIRISIQTRVFSLTYGLVLFASTRRWCWLVHARRVCVFIHRKFCRVSTIFITSFWLRMLMPVQVVAKG